MEDGLQTGLSLFDLHGTLSQLRFNVTVATKFRLNERDGTHELVLVNSVEAFFVTEIEELVNVFHGHFDIHSLDTNLEIIFGNV